MGHLESAIEIPYWIETLSFLLSVVVVVLLSKRFNISPILGYLLVGVLLGPHSLKLFDDATRVRHLAELGVVFLLFTLGLELSFARLKALARPVFILGGAQVVLSSMLICWVAFSWGNPFTVAYIIGACLALSSTAMVVQVLTEQGQMASKMGRHTFAILLFQDLAVVPILILIPLLKSSPTHDLWWQLGIALLEAIAAVGLLIILSSYLLKPIIRKIAATRNSEVFTAITLLIILGLSALTALAGLSMALGAFLAGVFLADSEFKHQIETEIEPFKGLLLGLFFASVGMNIDLGVALQQGFWVIFSVLGLLVLKTGLTTVCARIFGLTWSEAMRIGLMLAGAGEFAFVVIGHASLNYQLIDTAIAQFMVVVAGLSMMATPLLAILGQAWAKKLSSKTQQNESLDSFPETLHHQIIILGYGRMGRTLAIMLQQAEVHYLALDQNSKQVQLFREQGENVFYGDVRRLELLKKCGLEKASAVVLTLNNENVARGVLKTLHQHWPSLPVFVRAHNIAHRQAWLNAGAHQVIAETFEASLQLGEITLMHLGFSAEMASQNADQLRQKGTFVNLAQETWDLDHTTETR